MSDLDELNRLLNHISSEEGEPEVTPTEESPKEELDDEELEDLYERIIQHSAPLTEEELRAMAVQLAGDIISTLCNAYPSYVFRIDIEGSSPRMGFRVWTQKNISYGSKAQEVVCRPGIETSDTRKVREFIRTLPTKLIDVFKPYLGGGYGWEYIYRDPEVKTSLDF